MIGHTKGVGRAEGFGKEREKEDDGGGGGICGTGTYYSGFSGLEMDVASTRVGGICVRQI